MDFTMIDWCDLPMVLSDALLVTVAGMYMHYAVCFVKMAQANTNAHNRDAVVQQHFNEHFLACLVGIFGATVTFLSSIVHLIEQNIINASESTLAHIEYVQDFGISVTLISGILFMIHMRHEETKGHPFYCREYHEKP